MKNLLLNDSKFYDLKVCFGCLKQGTHMSKQCNERLTCKVCTKSHPTMLHQEQSGQCQQQQSAQQNQQQQQQSNKINACGLNGAGVNKGAYPSIILVMGIHMP